MTAKEFNPCVICGEGTTHLSHQRFGDGGSSTNSEFLHDFKSGQDESYTYCPRHPKARVLPRKTGAICARCKRKTVPRPAMVVR